MLAPYSTLMQALRLPPALPSGPLPLSQLLLRVIVDATHQAPVLLAQHTLAGLSTGPNTGSSTAAALASTPPASPAAPGSASRRAAHQGTGPATSSNSSSSANGGSGNGQGSAPASGLAEHVLLGSSTSSSDSSSVHAGLLADASARAGVEQVGPWMGWQGHAWMDGWMSSYHRHRLHGQKTHASYSYIHTLSDARVLLVSVPLPSCVHHP